MTLSASLDKAVKAYLEHTNSVLAGDATLNISYLTQPFNALAGAGLSIPFPNQVLPPPSANVIAAPPTAASGAAAAAAVADEVAADGKKRKRVYKPRDPNAPKRPLTAYFRYLAEVRPRLVAELAKDPNSAHKPGDLSKEATERWNSMSQSQREPYHEAYRQALHVYNADLEEYKRKTGQDVEGGAPTLGMYTNLQEIVTGEEEEDERPAPPPPKAKKPATAAANTSSPEVGKKTPKSALKKDKKPASDAMPTPVFNSVNASSAPSEPTPAASKKRKSEAGAAEDGTAKKKRASRPSKAGADAADDSTPAPKKAATKEKKKSRPSEA